MKSSYLCCSPCSYRHHSSIAWAVIHIKLQSLKHHPYRLLKLRDRLARDDDWIAIWPNRLQTNYIGHYESTDDLNKFLEQRGVGLWAKFAVTFLCIWTWWRYTVSQMLHMPYTLATIHSIHANKQLAKYLCNPDKLASMVCSRIQEEPLLAHS